MINVAIRPHRPHLRANTAEGQKLFAMVQVAPESQAAGARPPLALTLIIDTSGSMREFADSQTAEHQIRQSGVQGQQVSTPDGQYEVFNSVDVPTKLDQACQTAHRLVDDGRLAPDDKVAVVHFDDSAATLVPLTRVAQRDRIHRAIDQLGQSSGGTQMAKGLRCALDQLDDIPPEVAKRALLLTDGKTFDEGDCRSLAARFSSANAPVVAIGIGTEYNERLMADLAQDTQGRPYHLGSMAELASLFDEELGTSVREVVTDVQATVRAVRGVAIDRLTRVTPFMAEVAVDSQPYRLGNIPSGDPSVFIFEFTIGGMKRPPSRARVAEVSLVGQIPGLGRSHEPPPLELSVTFTTDDEALRAVDPEVLQVVSQRNVVALVDQALASATVDAGRARHTLEVARNLTRTAGNQALTRHIDGILDELNRTGSVSPESRKTLTSVSRTKTVGSRAARPSESTLSAEEVRRATGV